MTYASYFSERFFNVKFLLMEKLIYLNNDELNQSEFKSSHIKRKYRDCKYRMSDLILNKYDILSGLSYTTDSIIPMPVVNGIDNVDISLPMIAFSKTLRASDFSQIVHFYEPDVNFARILHNPQKYIKLLQRFKAVIGPDFSQKVGYQPFVCFSNSWWNKALSAYFQNNGVAVIPNVTWSTPASFEYAFRGLPKHSVIAINCTGIMSNYASKYLWRKGYEEAIRVLEPTQIIRYGDVMPGEFAEISVYYENKNLKNLRNGR
jgi:hypothetical protein